MDCFSHSDEPTPLIDLSGPEIECRYSKAETFSAEPALGEVHAGQYKRFPQSQSAQIWAQSQAHIQKTREIGRRPFCGNPRFSTELVKTNQSPCLVEQDIGAAVQ